MILIRMYWFPGFFFEANPESSTRHIGNVSPTSKLVRPLVCLHKSSGGRAAHLLLGTVLRDHSQ
jgi:hypothetical protein